MWRTIKGARGGENMTLDENWVTEMANLFAKRDHARTMQDRWTKKVTEAEEAIITLKMNHLEPVPDPEPIPEPVSEAV
jgi:hypothetical protein